VDTNGTSRRRTERRKRNILRVPPSQPTSLQWLGETTVNRGLVREALEEHQTTTMMTSGALVKVLDAGCDVGGTWCSSSVHATLIIYHGISISAPEIHQAQRLASSQYYASVIASDTTTTTTTTTMDIQFTQYHFDDPLKDALPP